MLDELPNQLSLSLAAFKRLYVDTRLVKYAPDVLWHDGTGRGYIKRWELQKALGHEITLKECWAADAKLDARRRYQRAYRRQGRKGTH